MTTTIINLWGGPGSGKSTTAAELFVKLKKRGVVVELVQEAAKESAWHKQEIVQADIFFEQVRRVFRLLGKVQVIINDSPIELSGFYPHFYGDDALSKTYRQLATDINAIITATGHEIHDYWVKRTKPYEAAGRYQSAEEAKRMDQAMNDYFRAVVSRAFVKEVS